jgi:hypothetical protein
VVCDAFLDLSDGDPTLPDTGDLEADLKAGPARRRRGAR